jgi:tripartite ATP-independent transporter DctM subunit
MAIVLILLSTGIFLLSGAGLAYIVGALGVMVFWITGNGNYLAVLPQRIFSQIDVFSLMAMPLFMLTGEVMNRMGSTRALINFSKSLVGRFKGGLGHVNILTSVFFAGVSGSAAADAAALTNTLVPAMEDEGYSRPYAGAVTAASAIIGPIIPPSIVMIFYGALMQTSIGGLFAAGIIPGILLSVVLLGANTVFAHRGDHPGGRGTELPAFFTSFKQAAPALSLPVIILGGIVFGVVTPTEAAALAVLAAAAAGIFYGDLSLETIYESLKRTASIAGMIFIVMSAAACTAWVGSLEQWPELIAALAINAGFTGVQLLLLVNFVFLLAGMIMNVPMALFLLVPLFGPVLVSQGFEPIHLGVVLCFNLTLGMITPPFGGVLIVVSSVSGENYWKLALTTLPFVFIELALLIVIILVPGLSLFLPRLLGFL